MKKNYFFRILLTIVIFRMSLANVDSALAHGGEPRLEISAERTNPGGVITIRGVDFEPEETITLTLVGQQQTISVGEVLTDVEGTFTQIVALPADIPEGIYTFVVVHDELQIVSPALAIQGMAMVEGDDSQRTEADGLLVPMPTALVNPVTQRVVNRAVVTQAARRPTYGLLLIAVLLGAGITLVLLLRHKPTAQ